MKENPYSKMIEIIKKQGASYNPPSIQIGVVISPNPLTIKIGDLPINKDNILITDYLLQGYKRKIKVPEVTTTGETGENSGHKHNISKIGIEEAEITFLDTLKQGDKLAILPTSDKQTYIVLARVVGL